VQPALTAARKLHYGKTVEFRVIPIRDQIGLGFPIDRFALANLVCPRIAARALVQTG